MVQTALAVQTLLLFVMAVALLASRRERKLSASVAMKHSVAAVSPTTVPTPSLLQASSVRKDKMVDHCPLPAIRCRGPLRNGCEVLEANEAFLRLTGHSETLVGEPVYLVGTEAEERDLEGLNQAVLTGGPAESEFRLRRRDGSWLWAELTVAGTLENGVILDTIAVLRDITDQKRIENEVQRYARELKQRNQELSEAVASAKRRDELKSRFLANMSHEIRTPMNGILATTELLLTTGLDSEQRDYAITIQNAGNSLIVLLNDILDLSRIEAGKLALQSVQIQPRTLVTEATSLLALNARSKGLELECSIDDSVPTTAFGDAGRLKQIIQNLVSNAIKFTETGSIRVRLRTQKASTDVVVLFCEVSDTGIGVPQEQRSRLFNRFAQVDTPHRSKYGGSGLGLAISQQIVHLMGGEIGYLDNNGGGSTFWFHVPLLVRSTEQAEPALSSAADAQGTSEPAPCRILVVEDNEVNQKIALRLIEKSGHQAKAVSNGRLAVEELSTTAYDLVLMDVQMPEMDGFEATMAIRSLDKAIRSVPVIAMTANAMAGDRERCLQAGMDDYVSKPVNLKLLRKTIDKWLIRSRSGQTMLESEPVGSSAR